MSLRLAAGLTTDRSPAIIIMSNRDVAQLGSVLPWGGRGRRFKSCRSDFFSAYFRFSGQDLNLYICSFGLTSLPLGFSPKTSCRSDFFSAYFRFSGQDLNLYICSFGLTSLSLGFSPKTSCRSDFFNA